MCTFTITIYVLLLPKVVEHWSSQDNLKYLVFSDVGEQKKHKNVDFIPCGHRPFRHVWKCRIDVLEICLDCLIGHLGSVVVLARIRFVNFRATSDPTVTVGSDALHVHAHQRRIEVLTQEEKSALYVPTRSKSSFKGSSLCTVLILVALHTTLPAPAAAELLHQEHELLLTTYIPLERMCTTNYASLTFMCNVVDSSGCSPVVSTEFLPLK